MRLLKILFLSPFVALFLAATAMAQMPSPYDPYMGLDDYAKGVPSQAEKDARYGLHITGSLSGLNMDENTITIRTVVPGLAGPREAEIPYAVDENTTITACFESSDCVVNIGTEGLRMLNNFERLAGPSSRKDVVAVADEFTDRLVELRIDYR